MASDALILDVKKMLIDVSNLPDLTPEAIDPKMPLFADGLGLDSIDVLELVVTLDKTYGLKIKNDETGRAVLHNVESIANAIADKQNTMAPTPVSANAH